MSKILNKYPVVLFIYMRPEATLTLLNKIIQAGIEKIYIFADGPKNKEGSKVTALVRQTVEKFIQNNPKISYKCSFSVDNKGLEQNIVSGLNQVFRDEDAAIILEDDCIPHPDFFRYMTENLNIYQNVEKIMSISGTGVGRYSKYSYDFSRYQLCWGWGTWKRAWEMYDSRLSTLGQRNFNYLNKISEYYWQNIFKLVKSRDIKTWDYQWTYAHFIEGSIAIIPSENLVSNIGFDNVATHTKISSIASNMATKAMSFPLSHPVKVVENIQLTKAIERKFYLHPTAILGLLKYIFLSTMKKIL